MKRVSGRLRSMIPQIARFVFGDLHLEHIRDWRVEAFRELASELLAHRSTSRCGARPMKR